MAWAGIDVSNALGIQIPELRQVAKKVGKDHFLAQQLWETGIHEARILASMIDDPKAVTEAQMDAWADAFDSWDVTDQCINNLLHKTPYAYAKALTWSHKEGAFTKRAGFVMMAALAVHDKRATNQVFEAFFPRIVQEASDGRNYVKKAVNWALRQIGKRNVELHQRAIEVAQQIQQQQTASAKWIATDALRELTSAKIQARIRKRSELT